jgi:hypothetical protein
MRDSRQGFNKQFTLTDLLRQPVYNSMAGYYEYLKGAERLWAETWKNRQLIKKV